MLRISILSLLLITPALAQVDSAAGHDPKDFINPRVKLENGQRIYTDVNGEKVVISPGIHVHTWGERCAKVPHYLGCDRLKVTK